MTTEHKCDEILNRFPLLTHFEHLWDALKLCDLLRWIFDFCKVKHTHVQRDFIHSTSVLTFIKEPPLIRSALHPHSAGTHSVSACSEKCSKDVKSVDYCLAGFFLPTLWWCSTQHHHQDDNKIKTKTCTAAKERKNKYNKKKTLKNFIKWAATSVKISHPSCPVPSFQLHRQKVFRGNQHQISGGKKIFDNIRERSRQKGLQRACESYIHNIICWQSAVKCT